MAQHVALLCCADATSNLHAPETVCDAPGAENSRWRHVTHHSLRPWTCEVRGLAATPAVPDRAEAQPASIAHQQDDNIESLQATLHVSSTSGNPLAPNVPKRAKRASIPREATAAHTASQHNPTGGSSHPAMEALPLVEKYMKLRASGHHVSEEEELQIMQTMVARASQVDRFESMGSSLAVAVTHCLWIPATGKPNCYAFSWVFLVSWGCPCPCGPSVTAPCRTMTRSLQGGRD